MEFDAITIDTSIFERNGLKLEGGMLNQLKQFKSSHLCFVLSEIVKKEVHQHLIKKAKEAKDDIKKAIEKVNEQKVASENIINQIKNILKELPSDEDTANNRLKAFLIETDAQIIPADTIEINNLVAHYFESLPPFEETGKKKYEFPDAIALISLGKWAEENKLKILAVSKDKGWHKFADASNWIDIEDDLAVALDKLQKQIEKNNILHKFITDIASGGKPKLLDNIKHFINDVVTDASHYDVDATADFESIVGDLEIELNEISFLKKGGNYQSYLVQTGNNLSTSTMELTASVSASCDFAFVVRDSIDNDYIYIGDSLSKIESDLNVEILVTLEGDFSDLNNDFEITNIELVKLTKTLDFGHIGPDYRFSDSE